MGGDSSTKSSKRKKRLDSSSSSSASSDSESPVGRKSRHRHRSESHRSRSSRHGSSRRESEGTERSHKRKSKKDDRKEKRKKEHRKRSRRESKREVSDSDESRSSDGVDGDDYSEPELRNPESVVRDILKRFPSVADDLKQLLQMIDGGQAVDTRGMSDASLVKILKKLFLSLNLKQKDTGVFLLPPKTCPTLEIVGPVIYSHLRPTENQSPLSESPKGIPSLPSEEECRKATDEAGGGQSTRLDVGDDSSVPCKRRQCLSLSLSLSLSNSLSHKFYAAPSSQYMWQTLVVIGTVDLVGHQVDKPINEKKEGQWQPTYQCPAKEQS